MIPHVTPRLPIYLFRTFPWLSLCLLSVMLLSPTPAWSQPLDPSPGVYPPTTYSTPQHSQQVLPPAAATRSNTPPPKKRSWWKRLILGNKRSAGGRPGQQGKSEQEKEDALVNVGPRTHTTSADTLIRIPQRVTLPNGTSLTPGFYLGRRSGQTLLLKRGSQEVAQLPLSTSANDDPTQASDALKDNSSGYALRAQVLVQDTTIQIILRDGMTTYYATPLQKSF